MGYTWCLLAQPQTSLWYNCEVILVLGAMEILLDQHWLTFSADSSSITINLESRVYPQANKSLILFTLFCSPLALEGKVRFSCSVFSDSVLPHSPTVFQPMIWTHCCFDVGQVSFSIIKHLLTYDTQRGVDIPCPAKAKIKVSVANVFTSFFSAYKHTYSLCYQFLIHLWQTQP